MTTRTEKCEGDKGCVRSMTTRREFPKKVKLATWQRSGGCCEDCGIKIVVGNGPEYDHVIEAYLGGEPTLENCIVLCIPCHKAKTTERRPEIDKTRRTFEKQANLRRARQPMPGSRRSKFKRKMDGTVELR